MHKRVSARKAVLVRKTLRSRHTPLTITQHDSGLGMVVLQFALEQNRGLSVAGAYMPAPPQISQSFRRLLTAFRPRHRSFFAKIPTRIAHSGSPSWRRLQATSP
ncbi:putative dispersed gene family protein 1 (DGF-1) [Trypanosoma cruzi]|nr:putative dispersed gene family protein 1 (DGF-1) [Trypanosoma cruzi]